MQTIEYSPDAQRELHTLHDRSKMAGALQILEAERVRLMYLTDNRDLAQVLRDTETALDTLYNDPKLSDPHIVKGIAIELCAAARRALLETEIN